jgi:hypothetical protein
MVLHCIAQVKAISTLGAKNKYRNSWKKNFDE